MNNVDNTQNMEGIYDRVAAVCRAVELYCIYRRSFYVVHPIYIDEGKLNRQ